MAVDSYMCPSCGSEVKVGAACPGCVPKWTRQAVRKKKVRKKIRTAPRRKPWEQDSIHDGLDLPDEDFDYEEFLKKEFGKGPHREVGIKLRWWVAGVVLVGALVWLVLVGLF